MGDIIRPIEPIYPIDPVRREREQDMSPKGKKKDEKPDGRSFRDILLEEMKKLKKTG